MSSLSFPAWLMLALTTLAGSVLFTWLSLVYASRRRMIDQPGQRRSHSVPTPRGGGTGIVLAVVAGLSACWIAGADSVDISSFIALLASIMLVALVGWIDDHGGLGALVRLLAHAASALLLCVPVMLLDGHGILANPALPWILAALLACAIAIVWSINLHNFMDGINGLLATQAIFVFSALSWLCLEAGRSADAQRIGLLLMATLGFLPFNFPRARIFMGDVGSGVLGLLIIVSIGWQIAAVPGEPFYGLIACSAFVVDSTATLLSRMLSGRRWYSAHREHLYQWLVRSGFSHARVVGFYMAWNLLVVVPALLWVHRESAIMGASSRGHAMSLPAGSEVLFSIYAIGALVWVFGKRYCLNRCKDSRVTAS